MVNPGRVLPRLVLAAPTSGTGKTTIATGLMAALTQQGLTVSPHKVGPDYIDPAWHGLAAGRPGRNLDSVMCDPRAMTELLWQGSQTPHPADVAIIEGVMGLFDGQIGGRGAGSTAHVAALTGSPVVLVVDAGGTTRSLAPVVHGFATFDPSVRIAGVIVNRTGSARQEAEISDALHGVGVPVLGMIPRTRDVAIDSRHLGLLTPQDSDACDERIEAMAALVTEHCDLSGILRVAHGAPALTVSADSRVVEQPRECADNAPVVAVFSGPAFTFTYQDNIDQLRAAGARVHYVNPLVDDALPHNCAGLVIGGGYPQVHATELSGAKGLRADVARAVSDGMPTIAECAGFAYLSSSLDDVPMVGALPARAQFTKKLTLGYRAAVCAADHPTHQRGERIVGHEFHRTHVTPQSGNSSQGISPAWHWRVHSGTHWTDGFATSSLVASYLHQHWGTNPAPARRFVSLL